MVDCSELAKDFVVELYFLRSKKRRITTPTYNGHQPQFHYSGHDVSARQLYPDVLQVNRRDTARANFAFLSYQEHIGNVFEGMDFSIREGQITVGRGKAQKVIDLPLSTGRSVVS